MKLIAYFIFFLLGCSEARAYIPPAYFIYEQMAQPREKSSRYSYQIQVSKPVSPISNMEENLITYVHEFPVPAEGGWPVLSLLFSSSSKEIETSVEKFGISTVSEDALLVAPKEEIIALKDTPKTYYRPDPQMELKRYKQSYAWSHVESNPATSGARSVWMEMDTFIPLKITGPCPKQLDELPWILPGEGTCELEYKNVFSLKAAPKQTYKLVFSKNNAPALLIVIERTNSKPSSPPLSENKIIEPLFQLVQTLLH